MNTLYIGEGGKEEGHQDSGLVFKEGGDEEGMESREESGIPATEAGRKKWFLNEANRKEWEWEEGTTYGCDFFNPYLDFNGTAMPFYCLYFGIGILTPNQSSHSNSLALLCLL